jgi:hypothetical protein
MRMLRSVLCGRPDDDATDIHFGRLLEHTKEGWRLPFCALALRLDPTSIQDAIGRITGYSKRIAARWWEEAEPEGHSRVTEALSAVPKLEAQMLHTSGLLSSQGCISKRTGQKTARRAT